MAKKLIPKSRLVDTEELDSVKAQYDRGKQGRFDILLEAQHCWDSLRTFRIERERAKNYTYGKQWDDSVIVDGVKMTEEEYIIQQGSIPLKNNLIRRLVKTVLGVYQSQNKEPICNANDRDEQKLGEVMSAQLKCNWNINRMSTLLGRLFEDYIIGGAIFTKEWAGWKNEKKDCWTDIVSPNHVFYDGIMRDVRHWDLRMIGEIHDIPFEDLCSKFAKGQQDIATLRSIYSLASRREYLNEYTDRSSSQKLSNIDFLHPLDTKLCRVIEVWRKELKPRFRCHDYLNGDYYKDEIENEDTIKKVNEDRLRMAAEQGMPEEEVPLIEYEWFMDSYWYYRFMTPFGDVLMEGETPYAHKSHPYTIKLYPFIDGEIHSFVSDIIDQQRYVNRLITLNDFIIRAGAKGVLMYPETMVSEDMSKEQIMDEWTRFNGVIFYTPKPGVEMPKQIANNSTNIGIHELLQLEMNLLEDVSGVTGALQGKPGYSGTSASLYAQQQQNSASSLLDILSTFSDFVVECSIKKVKNIQQFYDSKKTINIVGKTANGVLIYDPAKINDIEFDITITENASSPVYRMAGNDFLMEIWKAGQISVEQLLQHGNFPFADDLLQSIQSQKEQLEKGEMPEGLSPELKNQVAQNANQQAVQALQSQMRR